MGCARDVEVSCLIRPAWMTMWHSKCMMKSIAIKRAPINSNLKHLPTGNPWVFDCRLCRRVRNSTKGPYRVENLNRKVESLFWNTLRLSLDMNEF